MRLLINSKVCFLMGAILFILNSCTEIYNPDIEVRDKIIYVEGTITNVYGPHSIWLRYTSTYGDKATFPPVIGASVLILEDNTREYVCTEVSEGLYTTENTFIARKGHSYTLKIETADGNIFESIPQVLPIENIPIDTIYGLAEIKALKRYNYYGEFSVIHKKVNQLYADVKTGNSNTYYRFSGRTILEDVSRLKDSKAPLYFWESLQFEDVEIIEVNSQLDQVSKFPITCLSAEAEDFTDIKYRYSDEIEYEYYNIVIDTIELLVETDTGIIAVDSLVICECEVEIDDFDDFYGWILEIEQLSITRDAYTFWSDIKKLEETEGEIFDPIATQLRGNMHCVSDENTEILGLFEVASKISTNAFVNFKSTGDRYLIKSLEGEISIPWRGWQDSIPPDFWVEKIREAF